MIKSGVGCFWYSILSRGCCIKIAVKFDSCLKLKVRGRRRVEVERVGLEAVFWVPRGGNNGSDNMLSQTDGGT